MNERIRELAEQAGLGVIFHLEEMGIDGEIELWKFAELIVGECASLCLDMKYTDPQPHHYAVMIKEHFGVEE
jgi:hypothetical protein